MGTSLAFLRDRLRLLAEIDNERQVFGSETHDYALAAPPASSDLAAFEGAVGALPAEYRAFLLELGSHGAGPYYGLSAAPEIFERGDQRGLVLAEQGCGGRSVLILDGAHRGEVWADWTREGGEFFPEAPGFLAWYAKWLDDALVEWTGRYATRIVLDGPEQPAELEAVTYAFDLIAPRASENADLSRTLGYLHVRERRWDDARASFERAATLGGDEPTTRRHLDLARMYVVMEAYPQAIDEGQRGLAQQNLWYSTSDQLRDTLERAYTGAGRLDEALAVLDARAEATHFSLAIHHRLAREYIRRNNVEGAGRALERALAVNGLFAHAGVSLDERIAIVFDPIVAELSARSTAIESAYLENLVDTIRRAN